MSTKDWIEKDYYKVLGVSKDATPRRSRRRTASWRETTTLIKTPATPRPNCASRRSPKPTTCCRIRLSARSTTRPAGCLEAAVSASRGVAVVRRADHLSTTSSAMPEAVSATSSAACSTAVPPRRPRFSTARGPRRGSDVEGEVTVDFVQAIEGVTVGMQMVSDTACEACRGTGARAGTIPHVCPTCEGSGMQTSTSGGVFAVTEPCRECRGRGMVVDDPCPVCHGSGRGKSTKTMQVRIPAGVTDGQRIRLKGRGGAGENGGAAGDLYVTVHVRAHPIFGRKGDNLTLTAPVTFQEAALGAEIEVPTLGGPPVKLRLSPGTPNGRTLRVRGKGVRKRDGTKGDLLVTVEVLVPEALNEQAREALNSYAEAVGTVNPRAKLFAAG